MNQALHTNKKDVSADYHQIYFALLNEKLFTLIHKIVLVDSSSESERRGETACTHSI